MQSTLQHLRAARTPKVSGAPNDYYLNARDGTNEHDGAILPINYAASIKVNGGGTITFRTYDSNCSAITNNKSFTFDLSDTVPPPSAATSMMPIKDALGTKVQWFHIDVTNVQAL